MCIRDRIQPDEVIEFVFRTYIDFGEDEGVQKLFEVPTDSPGLRVFKANLLSQLFCMATSPFDEFLNGQLDAFTEIADNHPEEKELQESTALIEYNLGCSCALNQGPAILKMFLQAKYGMNFQETARARFDAAISRVGKESRVGVMALLNRGFLFDDDERAIESWTTVIEADVANDEMRACALNNRAYRLAAQGKHERSIGDRTRVMELGNTSADRRFVALFERAKSQAALKKFQKAVPDLKAILESKDIGQTDKLHARIQQGVYLYFAGQIDDSREVLEMVDKLLNQDSKKSKFLDQGLRSQLASLIQDAIIGIDNQDSESCRSTLEEITQWNSSNMRGIRVSQPEAL